MTTINADWALFQDWCASVGAESITADATLVEAFLAELPVASGTQVRRLRAIRRGLAAAGSELDIPHRPVASTIRRGAGWADVRRALAQLPTTRYPYGLRGRRDGWVLVLIGELGLTRRQALAVTGDDVVLFPALTVAGRPVGRAVTAAECPACAVTRWLRVLGPAGRGWRGEVRDLLDPAAAANVDVHDCGSGLDGVWRQAPTLTPAIDRHGWLAEVRTVSLVTASTIMAQRQRLSGLPERFVARVENTGRFAGATRTELAEAYDDVDEQLARLLERSAAILSDSEGLLGRLSELGLG